MLNEKFNDLEEEYKEELRDFRTRWKLLVAQVELQKRLQPETAEALDAYLNSLKTIILEAIMDECDEEEKDEFKRVVAYVFGESEE